MRRADATTCRACGTKLEEVLITTHGSDLWSERPIAVDAFSCAKCGEFMLPRFLEPDEATQLLQQGIADAQAGRYDAAELAFRRVSNAWPGYAPARVNLAAL